MYLLKAPLGILQTDDAGNVTDTFLTENSLCAYLRADNFVFRMNPEDKAKVDITAMTYGKPAVNQAIRLAYDNSVFQVANGVDGKAIEVGTPESALQFPTDTIYTDENGKVTFEMISSDMPSPSSLMST